MDAMTDLIQLLSIAAIALVAFLTIGVIFARLYKRSTKETAFVRTGLGGQKVIMDGGPSYCRSFTSACWST